MLCCSLVNVVPIVKRPYSLPLFLISRLYQHDYVLIKKYVLTNFHPSAKQLPTFGPWLATRKVEATQFFCDIPSFLTCWQLLNWWLQYFEEITPITSSCPPIFNTTQLSRHISIYVCVRM